MRNNEVEAMYF